jgi:hypothetical protein
LVVDGLSDFLDIEENQTPDPAARNSPIGFELEEPA